MKKVSLLIAMIGLFSILVSPVPEKSQKPEVMRPVLLVIDIQNEFLPMIPDRERQLGLKMINAAIWLFRKHGFPIIRVYHTDPGYGPKPDSEAFQFPKSVIIKPEDAKIIKNYPNAFKKTELDNILQKKNANTLFLCGLSAVGCVLASYFGGKDLDYHTFMIKNAIMSHNSKFTYSIQEIFDAVGFEALMVMLKYSRE